MIVESIKKNKGKYTIVVENKEYAFSENIVLEYRLVEGHETSEEELIEAMAKEELEDYYSKACNYCIRYGKCEREIYSYLEEKGVSRKGIFDIIERMKKNRIILDDKLIDSLISSYARNGNGRLMIRHKLIEKGFHKSLIDAHLDTMDLDEYLDGLKKMEKKALEKYKKLDSKVKNMKVRNYLLQRGYSNSDIALLEE